MQKNKISKFFLNSFWIVLKSLFIISFVSMISCNKRIRKSCSNPKHLARPDAYTIIIESTSGPNLKNRNISLIEGRNNSCKKAFQQGENILIWEAIYGIKDKKDYKINALPFPSDKKSYANILATAKKIKTIYLADLSCTIFISYHSHVKFSLIQNIAKKKWEKSKEDKKKSLK